MLIPYNIGIGITKNICRCVHQMGSGFIMHTQNTVMMIAAITDRRIPFALRFHASGIIGTISLRSQDRESCRDPLCKSVCQEHDRSG